MFYMVTIQPGWTQKEDAAKLLGVSIRQLENLAALGRISKMRLPRQVNERSARVLYSIEDIDAIKAGKPRLPDPAEAAPAAVPERAIVKNGADPFAGLAAHLAAIARAFPPPTAERPWLTLAEAAEWSGLPAAWLLAQARAGADFATNVGTGKKARWRFNRASLK